ncbi:electron transport complex subunit RsxC [uncultured Porphyromonas sp.]|uniref:electron transport complex subunit RsxC n=1 Tax=uncultured Porphyromonas sp. TaxID=159274 RepID=UPI002618E783|nr:electron transport complex subunit RsxC [uncultured Porphyromonas sp.]
MLKTFRIGGIHPPERKLSSNCPIEELPMPERVRIPLAQHIGAPAEALVKRGDTVKVGTLIAKAGGFISANIHSSVSGVVEKLEEVIDASGYPKMVITIKTDGEDTWEETIDRSPKVVREVTMSPEEIVARIQECGIVGMGGATFPTNVKLLPPKGSQPEVVIINGVECEPYLTADHRLMLERGEELLVGLSILMKAAGVSRGVIGIENNKKDAIQHLTELAKSFTGIEIQPLKVKYPQGGEKQLIDAVIRCQVKSGQLPITVGAIVQNVGTTLAVYEAVQKRKPLFERIVTVTGVDLPKPSNFLVRIGTSSATLIEAAGGLSESCGKIISGGPMMGKALVTDDVPIAKGSSGILVLKKEETVRKPMRACIRCAKCVHACPMGLNPAFLMRDTVFKDWEVLEKNHIVDCIECGSCSFSCPANRPLLDHIRQGKRTVMGIMRSRKS